MHIVAMAAGYIDPPPAELVIALRKQVLVAVTSNWQVMCFDHNLRLLWETTILVCHRAPKGMSRNHVLRAKIAKTDYCLETV